MGASQSKNIASAVSEVTNSISQNTSADQSQVDIISQKINLANCSFTTGKDFNINLFASSSQESNQILDALQDSTVQNDIAQKMAQEAMSKVGPLAVGFSEATNNMSTFAKAKNVVVDAMRATSQQMSIGDQEFNCENSTFNIGGSINWNFDSESDFLSTQTLNNNQVSNLVNNVTQDITQRSTSTVMGFGGSIIALAILLAAIGYVIAKPLDTISGRILVTSLILISLVIIIMLMFLYNTPPFFQKPIECSPYSPVGGCSDPSQCVDPSTKMTYIRNPPLRYMHSLIGQGGPNSGVLLSMIISASPDEPNLGYTMNRYLSFQDPDPNKNNRWMFDTYWNNDTLYPTDLKPDQLPNPLVLPNNQLCRIPNEYRIGSGQYNFGKCTPRPLTTINNDIVGSCTGGCPCFPVLQFSLQEDDPKTILAIANIDAWREYLNDPSPDRRLLHQKHARFVMSHFLEYPCMFYVHDDELVTVFDNVFRAKDVIHQTYKFQDYGGNPNIFLVGTESGGHLLGPVGVYNNNSYKLQKFMKSIGIYLVILFVFIVLLVVWFRRRK